MNHPDPAFPVLHGRPPAGWLNDPNGVCLVDGVYHVFFQYNPDAPIHQDIHWGHSSSTDLVRWRSEPTALFPRPGHPDSHGCWTGCVVDDAGTPTAVYSAISDGSGNAEVVLARSDRTLHRWSQDEHPVIGMPDDPLLSDVRDPFVFRHEGRRYAIQGAGHKEGLPQILLYSCDDLTRWTLLGPLLTGDAPIAARHAPANIWECPNLVRLGDRWLLVLSLWRWQDGAHSLAGVRYLSGDLVGAGATLRFVPETGGPLDSGPSFYAPQLLPLPDRTLMWAWAWEDGRDQTEIDRAGWAGVLTHPRELRLENGTVTSVPVPELTALRQRPLPIGLPVRDRSFEVVAEVATTLLLTTDGVERTVVTLPEGGRILVDGSLIEVFPPSGVPSTLRAYPTAESFWTVGGDRRSTRCWSLG